MPPKRSSIAMLTERSRTMKQLLTTSNGKDCLRVAQLRATESKEPHAARLEAVQSRVAHSR